MVDAILLFIVLYHYFTQVDYSIELSIASLVATVLAFAYILLSIGSGALSHKKFALKLTFLVLIITYTVIYSTATEINLRQKHNLDNLIYDHPLQVEEAIGFLLQGENPYSRNYINTPMAAMYSEKDVIMKRALHHFISLPTHLYLSLPFYLSWQKLFGWYDQRIVHLAFFALSLLVAYRLFNRPKYKLLAILTIGLNPLLVGYFIRGTDDIIFLGTILLSLLLLKRARPSLSLLALAVAITTKQTAWLILPFYLFHFYQQGFLKQHPVKKILPAIVLIVLAILPFVIWDGPAFFEDVYLYPAGSLSTSYPIKGLGIGPTLVKAGVISSPNSYFPFGLMQAVILLPLLYWQIKIQRKHNKLAYVVINYGIFLWAFWLSSRFFNASYISVVSTILVLGLLLWSDDQ